MRAQAGAARHTQAQLLASTTFRCTGADLLKSAATGAGTVVLLADFYRAGDGIDESFTAKMIVADHDIATDIPGEQTLWVPEYPSGDRQEERPGCRRRRPRSPGIR